MVNKKKTRRFHGLPQKQYEVFVQIALNNDIGHHPATLDALERKGFIVCHEENLPGRFPVVIKRYQVPIGFHFDWCNWLG